MRSTMKRELVFDVEANLSPTRLPNTQGANGLFQTLFFGYSYHIPITLSPDDVMNTITTLWGKYVSVNAEKLRSQFVDHEGKKVLEYVSGGTYHENRMEEFFDGLLELVAEDQGEDRLGWARQEFSTTTFQDRLIRSAAMLASQKEYYEYHCMLLCGFPKITLLGSESDWEGLLHAVTKMPTLKDPGLESWKNTLIFGVLPYFLYVEESTSEQFWQSAVTNEAYGSGPQDFDGWAMQAFNPFNEKGQWLRRMELHDALDLTVDFEIKIDDNGDKFTLKIKSGVDGAEFRDGSLFPNKTLIYEESPGW